MNLHKSIPLICLILIDLACVKTQTQADSLMQVNYQKLVAPADLNYDTPVNQSTEGMPIGNGRTGSLVWTTPQALHFQINRVDLFCMDNNSRSFPFGHTSYSSGCGYVDIGLEGYGDGIFTGSAFHQHLSVYDGLTTVTGNGVTARALAWNDADVIAVETDDQRDNPTAVNIDLRMLRYSQQYIPGINYQSMARHAVEVQTGAHSALSRLEIRDGRIILVQEFREGKFYSASAVAIGVVGRESKAHLLQRKHGADCPSRTGPRQVHHADRERRQLRSREDVAGWH
jgi:alpha-L-fucosidase 2